MEESIGRDTEPTTSEGDPDAPESDPPESDPPELHVRDSDARMRDAEIRRLVRDVPPPIHYDDTAFTDPDEYRRSVDPLDPQKPSRANGDPLDPDGHVI